MTEQIAQLIQLIGMGFVIMLPLSNPLTSMTMFLSLGEGMSHAERRRQVGQAAVYVVMIMLVTYFVGTWIIHGLGISLPGIRIAGGMIVAFIGFRMLFPDPADASMLPPEDDTQLQTRSQGGHSIAFVPLALPGTAGPGTIAMIISTSSKMTDLREDHAEWVLIIGPIIIAVMLGVLFYVCLRSADKLAGFLGHEGIDAISRIMGFLLICMGVQLVIDGVLELVEDGGVAQVLSAV